MVDQVEPHRFKLLPIHSDERLLVAMRYVVWLPEPRGLVPAFYDLVSGVKPVV